MEPYKIIDVHSCFFCNDSFQQAGVRHNENYEDGFFAGYADAEKYLSLDFDCPLNRLAVISTGAKENFRKNRTKKGKFSG